MASRLDLQTMLEKLLGSRNVYFNPPMSLKMKYPAIVYSLDNIENTHANNEVYNQYISYSIILVDANPDSELVSKLSRLPKVRFGNHYIADNLNHWVFTIYY